MLHAFDEDLNERWAFVPPSVTSKLRDMLGEVSSTRGRGKSNSVFNVDGPIAVKDIYIHATKEWKTVLVGGLGYGGKSYYVLDITDPDDPQHMFTISNNDTNKTVNYWAADGTKSSYPYLSAPEHIDYQKLGDTWSRPSIMLLPYQSTDGKIKQRWTMVFGGGYGGGASSGFGPYVFVLDFEPDTTLSPNTSGGQIISAIPIPSDPSSDIPNGATAHMSVVTSDGTALANYYGGIAYFTDLQGQLWKYNLSKATLDEDNDNLFELNLAHRAEGTLANDRFGFNQVATTIVQDDSGASSLFNYFGTGNLSRIQGRDSTINNRIFGIRDIDFPNNGLTLTGTAKNAATSQNIDDPDCVTDITQNWHSNTYAKSTLSPSPGAATNDWTKVIGRAGLYNKSIFFSIYRPEDLACPLTGTSQIIEISDGCGGVSQYNVGEGLITAPVIDNRGNIYVGVSNLADGTKIGGDGRDNITRIGDVEESLEGSDWKAWQEITY
jgi:type IV pilus assembly protein PilY1